MNLAGTFQKPGEVRELALGIGADRLCRLNMPKSYGNLGSGNAGLERRPACSTRDRPTPLSWTCFASHRDLPFQFVHGCVRPHARRISSSTLLVPPGLRLMAHFVKPTGLRFTPVSCGGSMAVCPMPADTWRQCAERY